MKNYLLVPVLALTALVSVGCSIGDTTSIPASVPGDRFGRSNRVDAAGSYTLFRVTQWDQWGAPASSEKLTTVNLQAGDLVGFDYVVPKDKQYSPDAQPGIVAFAATTRINLGPIHSFDEKYFWAKPGEWDSYWAGRPERVLMRKATFY